MLPAILLGIVGIGAGYGANVVITKKKLGSAEDAAEKELKKAKKEADQVLKKARDEASEIAEKRAKMSNKGVKR